MNQYFQDDNDNNAANMLSMMSDDMIRNIISLVSNHGLGLMKTLQAKQDDGLPRVLGIFSNDFIKPHLMPDIMLGWAIINLAQLRTPNYGNEEYKKILKGAFSLPDELIEAALKRIETVDILYNAKSSGWWDKFANTVAEKARNWTNWGLAGLGFDESNLVDQTQAYDIDFLYEMKCLGQVVREFTEQIGLMQGQARISNSLGILKVASDATGDPNDAIGDLIGDVMGRTMLRAVPASMGGMTAGLMNAGAASTTKQASELASIAAAQHSGRNKTAVGRLIANIAGGKVVPSVMTGALLGGLGGVIKNLVSGDPGYGDPAEIGDAYGPDIADAYMRGDMNGLLVAMLTEASNAEMGDLLDDEDISDQVSAEVEALGDPFAGDPELGGLFTSFLAGTKARKKGRAAKRKIRSAARAERVSNRQASKTERQARRQEGKMDKLNDKYSEDQEATEDAIAPEGYPEDSGMLQSFEAQNAAEGTDDMDNSEDVALDFSGV